MYSFSIIRDLANEHAAAMVEGAAGMVLQGAKEGKHAAKLKVAFRSHGFHNLNDNTYA